MKTRRWLNAVRVTATVALLGSLPATAAPTRQQTLSQDLGGPPVHWDGEIVQRLQDGDEVCFVLDRRAYAYAYPAPDMRYMRFIACSPGAFDPVVFGPGRSLEVRGSLGLPQPRLIGGQTLDYPVVAGAFILPLVGPPHYDYPPPGFYPPPGYYPYPPYPYRGPPRFDPWGRPWPY